MGVEILVRVKGFIKKNIFWVKRWNKISKRVIVKEILKIYNEGLDYGGFCGL